MNIYSVGGVELTMSRIQQEGGYRHGEPQRYVWFKAVGRLPDDPMIHRYMLAYASDFRLVLTCL